MKSINDDDTLTWQEIELLAKCYPKNDGSARYLINNFIGYLPPSDRCIPHLPFIRTLIESYKNNDIDYDTYLRELEFHMRSLRNSEFRKCWWIVKDFYDHSDFELYNTELLNNRDRAKETIRGMVGYDPHLETSLHAELILRRLYQSDTKEGDFEYYNIELFAIAAILYRHAFLSHGADGADNSRLLGQIMCEEMGVCPITFEPKK